MNEVVIIAILAGIGAVASAYLIVKRMFGHTIKTLNCKHPDHWEKEGTKICTECGNEIN